MKAKTVANYIRYLAEVYEDSDLTSLKLQKLLYYSYAFYLVFKDERLFDSKIEKWTHGPVVPDIWQITDKEDFLINPIEGNPRSELSKDQKIIIEDVFKVYGRYAGWTLRNMTHAESPWNNAHTNELITDESLRNFFEPKKNEFIFELECIEDLEDIKIANSDPNDIGVEWEDLKARLNA